MILLTFNSNYFASPEKKKDKHPFILLLIFLNQLVQFKRLGFYCLVVRLQQQHSTKILNWFYGIQLPQFSLIHINAHPLRITKEVWSITVYVQVCCLYIWLCEYSCLHTERERMSACFFDMKTGYHFPLDNFSEFTLSIIFISFFSKIRYSFHTYNDCITLKLIQGVDIKLSLI